MDQDCEKRRDHRRLLHPEPRKRQTDDHADGRELIPRAEQTQEMNLHLFPLAVIRPLVIVVLAHRKAEEYDDQDLRHCDELYIGKADRAKEDIRTEPRECPDISEHHGNQVAPLLPRIRKAVPLQGIEDRDRQEADGQRRDRKPQKLRCHLHRPEGNNGKKRRHAHHIRLDDPVKDVLRKPPPPKAHAAEKRKQNVCKYDQKSGVRN